jgi:MHS family proline/betaine transporter-like MFS transporter
MPPKAFLIAALSAFVQYYDYHLFGFLAVKIANHFFPDQGATLQLQNAYLIMAIAMISKPVGALLLGKVGDVYGRSYIFNISLIGTAIGSTIIAFIPSYSYIGITSTILLLVARMVICALVSSGSDSVRVYIYEHISINKQTLGVSITNIFMQAGSFFASSSAWFFTQEFMPNYGWRLSFLLGGILGIIIVFLKNKYNIQDINNIKNEPKFAEFKELSTINILGKNLKLFLYCLVITGCLGSTTQFFIIFFGTYNFEILKNISQSNMQFYISAALCLYMVFSLISGHLADKIGCYKVALTASILLLFTSFAHIYVLRNNQVSISLFLFTIAILPFLTMPAAVMLKQSIPIVIRYRIFSMSHAVGSIFISAPTAFVSTFVYNKSGVAWLPILYFITTIILIFISLIKIKKLSKNP